MKTRRRFGTVASVLGATAGVVSVAGALTLLWGSQDLMSVVIHWIGEERVLGPENVLVRPDGGKLLTNPTAMARVVLLIWGVGVSQVIAGGFLLWKSVKPRSGDSPDSGPWVSGQ